MKVTLLQGILTSDPISGTLSTLMFRDGVSPQDILHIRQAFDNMRDESDSTNEIKLRRLKSFPLFTRQDFKKMEQLINMAKEDEYLYDSNANRDRI